MFNDSLKQNREKQQPGYAPLRPVQECKKDASGTSTRPERVTDRTLKCRFEMKYVISESKAAAMQRFIEPYLELDYYSKLQPHGCYPIVSLYLDSDNMQLCIESLRGKLKRFKLRIRSYSDEPNYPRFFEIKRRANVVIIKSRARVRTEDVAAQGLELKMLQLYFRDSMSHLCKIKKKMWMHLNSSNCI
jgi:hypothetical protein